MRLKAAKQYYQTIPVRHSVCISWLQLHADDDWMGLVAPGMMLNDALAWTQHATDPLISASNPALAQHSFAQHNCFHSMCSQSMADVCPVAK